MAQRHDENYNEQPMTRMGRIQQPSRRYRRLRHPSFTAAIWTANNPLLQRGEIGGEIDTHRIKMGDGVTYWNNLPYASDSIATWGDIQGNISDQTDLQDALDAKQDVLTAGTGISIDSDNVISNSGVRSVATGTTNGTISVNTGGTSAEVAVYGLGSAAYTPSSDYATAAQGVKADNAANKDLSNLTSTGANIGNWSSNVSNCITEIPQDINLTLSNGTLTLKAGSKVYKPNGSGVFDIVNIPNDIIKNDWSSGTGDVLLCVQSNNYLFGAGAASADSGTSTSPTTSFYYRTDENYIYPNNDSTRSKLTFPIAIVHITSGVPDKIDQVFNGFGYIGSTVFALPGVKGLIPDGRNADGTLKSSSFTINNVLTTTDTSGATGALEYYINGSGIFRANLGTNTYKEEKNIITNTAGVQQMVAALDMNAYRTNGKISGFTPKQVFRAVDYNDGDYIANCAMPSDRYIALSTSISSGYNYTAPADGYLSINKGGADGDWLYMRNTTNGLNVGVQYTGPYNGRLSIPVQKGHVIQVQFQGSGPVNEFRFIYANGAK